PRWTRRCLTRRRRRERWLLPGYCITNVLVCSSYTKRRRHSWRTTPLTEDVSCALSPDSEEPSTERQVQLLHSALRQCLGLIHCVILKEEEEWGELEGDYETMRKNVQLRLEHLLHSTKGLVETENTTLEVTPDHQCNEETDGAGGVFGLKMWTYRVLLELVHWADHAAQTLHVLHTEREEREEI
uniref:Ciliary neurotrophic factor n=1 Tax=Sander lucioperca TaxID=283035 RepID=A0A8D0CTT7_SANLU